MFVWRFVLVCVWMFVWGSIWMGVWMFVWGIVWMNVYVMACTNGCNFCMYEWNFQLQSLQESNYTVELVCTCFKSWGPHQQKMSQFLFRDFFQKSLQTEWFMLNKRFQGNFKSIEPSYFIEAMDLYRQEFRFKRKYSFANILNYHKYLSEKWYSFMCLMRLIGGRHAYFHG